MHMVFENRRAHELLRAVIIETLRLIEGRGSAANDGDDAPEHASVDAFAEHAFDNDDATYTHEDLQAIARRTSGQPSPGHAQLSAIRRELEGYGLKLATREPVRAVRGVTSSVNGTHPFAGSGGGGSGFSTGWGSGGFTSFGGGPGAMGSGKTWDPDAKDSLRMGSRRKK